MSISVTAKSAHTEAPFDVQFIEKTLEDNLSNIDAIDAFSEKVLNTFSTKSSKHKFLIQATRVDAEDSLEANLKIQTSVGALWDPKKDGYYSFEVRTAESVKYLLTVVWITVQ